MARVGTALEYGLGQQSTGAAQTPLFSTSVDPAAFGTGPNQPLDQLEQGALGWSQALTNELDRQSALDERDAHSQAVLLGTQAQAQAAQILRSAQENSPAGATGLTDTVTKQFDEYAANLIKYAPERTQDLLKEDLARIRLSLHEDAANYQTKARDAKASTDLGAALDESTQLLVSDPTKFDLVQTRFAALVNAAPGLTQQQRIDMLLNGTTALQVARVQGMIQQDPEGTLGLLKSGEQLVGLNGQQRQQLTNQAEVEVRRIDAERKAASAEYLRGVGDEVRFASQMLELGMTPAGLDGIRQRARGTPYQGDLQIAEGASDAARLHAMKPLPEQIDEINRLKQEPQTPESFAKLQGMIKATRGAAEAVQNGTELEYMDQLGMVKLQPVDVTDPASIAKRKQDVALASQQMGVQVPMLTKAERNAVVADISTRPPEEQIGYLQKMQDALGADFPSLMVELNDGPGGLPRSTRALLMVAGRAEAAPIVGALVEGMNTKDEDLNVNLKREGVSPGALDKEVTSALASFDATVGETYKLGSGGPTGTAQSLVADVHDVVARTAKVLMRSMDMQSAVKMAADLIVNTRYYYSDGIRIPREGWSSASEFTSALKNRLALLAPEDLQVPPSMVGLPPDRAAEVYRNDVVNGGRWITLPDESGVALVDADGNLVLQNNGRPVIMNFVAPRATPGATAPLPAPSGAR